MTIPEKKILARYVLFLAKEDMVVYLGDAEIEDNGAYTGWSGYTHQPCGQTASDTLNPRTLCFGA
jgi:hypothetical protein